MDLTTTQGGYRNLQIWRIGRSYERQKGAIYRREWNNLAFSVQPRPLNERDILYFDIRRPLPYPDQAFDAVFIFHIVEHLTPAEAASFLRQIHRVLKPSGRLRVSTPDLEDICRAYLARLQDHDRQPTEASLVRYEWSVLELIDQIVRVRSGGLMRDYLERGYVDRAYAESRFRDVFDEFYVPRPVSAGPPRTRLERLLRLTPRSFLEGVHRRIRELGARMFSSRNVEAAGDPRRSGEVNKWVYDSLSLTMLLEATGFVQVSRKTYRTSDIPEWGRFDLERSTHGDHPIEPSLYMEALRG